MPEDQTKKEQPEGEELSDADLEGVAGGVAAIEGTTTTPATTDLTAPRDVATGQASGKRTWKPIRF